RLAQARLSHLFFHQNAKGLKRQFDLTTHQAADIIISCLDCQHTMVHTGSEGVNPR
ncbi:POK11 protein, partial [Alcedo cyanopectus]|nr:POK11 protein [Ceyx cyanopectus]